MKKFLLFFVALIPSFIFAPALTEAAGASLYLSPNSGTFFVGSTFDVSIFINTGGLNINAVQVDLKFDPKRLQIASPTAGKSFIGVWIAQPTYSNIQGTASFKGGIPSPGINTTAGLVSTVTFRAIAPGVTTISFTDSSKALWDDGKGTNILTSLGGGEYNLAIPPPEGPGVFSSTHPDQNKWYKNPNPSFNWRKEEGVTGFSYSADFDFQGIPDSVSEGDFTSISYSNLKDGIWYFHIKAKKENVWGGTSHYPVRIDLTPPASFTPKIEPSRRTIVRQPIVSFATDDALSGFDHFEVKVINITPDRREREAPFFVEVASPYRLPALEIGKYVLSVRAFDRAGNWRDESMKFEIVPKGIGLSKEGVFFWSIFLPWWLALLILILIIAFATGTLLHRWKKQQELQENILQELRQRKEALRETKRIIKVRVREIK